MNYQWSMPKYEPVYYPEMDVIGQLNTTLLSGVVCGLLPLIVAAARGRIDWGAKALGVCFLAGIFKGYLLAVPAGLAMTAIIVLGDPRVRGKWNLLTGWQREAALEGEDHRAGSTAGFAPDVLIPTMAPVAQAPTGPAIATAPAAPAFAKPPDSDASAVCTACGAPILPNGDRLPPWCPRCGADFKAPRPAGPGPQSPPAVSGPSR